jgi:hypothetical protein
VLACLLAFAGALIQPAKAEVAVGDEGLHPQSFSERERLAVVGLVAFGVQLVRMGCDIASKCSAWADPGCNGEFLREQSASLRAS